MGQRSRPTIPLETRPTPSLDSILLQARLRLTYILQRLTRPETPTVEKANLYGQQDTLTDALDWMKGILALGLPDEQTRIHLRELARFLVAYHARTRQEASQQERERMNSLEWHNLTTGKLQGYETALSLLQSVGVYPH